MIMKDYKPGIIYCRCSNLMRIGKHVKIYKQTLLKKKCPNCGKMLDVLIRSKKDETTDKPN